jgi:hypothetical protein
MPGFTESFCLSRSIGVVGQASSRWNESDAVELRLLLRHEPRSETLLRRYRVQQESGIDVEQALVSDRVGAS